MIRNGHSVLVKDLGGDPQCELLEQQKFEQSPPEKWLQQVLDQAPGLLPIADIDDRLQLPLFSLGREVPAPGSDYGWIDNLFISRNGYVVVVETKLWRNPEAYRQVVAQLLEYAVRVRGWHYDDLERVGRKNERLRKQSLWERIQPDLPEAEWRDRVSENLSQGRMALAVVGDGIRSAVETLAEVLQGYPGFQFRLALIELRLFVLPEGHRLVVPVALTKTAEIERAVVRVEYVGATKPRVTVATPTLEGPKRPDRKPLSEQALLDELRHLKRQGDVAAAVAERLLALLTDPLQAFWGTGSFALKAPGPGGSGRMLSLCVVTRAGQLYAYLDWLQGQLIDWTRASPRR